MTGSTRKRRRSRPRRSAVTAAVAIVLLVTLVGGAAAESDEKPAWRPRLKYGRQGAEIYFDIPRLFRVGLEVRF